MVGRDGGNASIRGCGRIFNREKNQTLGFGFVIFDSGPGDSGLEKLGQVGDEHEFNIFCRNYDYRAADGPAHPEIKNYLY